MPKHTQKNILPLILIILDGWGMSTYKKGNATAQAETPNIDSYYKNFSYTKLRAHGKFVGLPALQVGNSEAGHINIGAGRIVEQEAVRISTSIKKGVFFKNTAFLEAIKNCKDNNSDFHIMGMLSDGKSAHSDPRHLLALIKLAKQKKIKNIYLHLFTDGRDSPKHSALKIISNLEKNFSPEVKLATLMGRFYGMDRKKKWSRTEKAYNALVLGSGKKAKNTYEAISESYNQSNSDEFIEPYVITEPDGAPRPRIKNNDSIVFFNLRSDRARQISKTFVQKEFNKMNPGSFRRRKVLKKIRFVAMTDFGPDLDSILTAFPGEDLKQTFPMTTSELTQLYITESEKHAHITYFFNGGYNKKVNGENYFISPSPNVRSYDEVPEMKSKKLTETVIKNLKNKKYDLTVLNFAAPDMIGHTGNLKAGIECCSGIDKYVGEIVKNYLKHKGTVIITADHGNIEEMINLENGEVENRHSANPVPFILINDKLKSVKLKNVGVLGDIAPTILDLLNITKPKIMSGKTLLK